MAAPKITIHTPGDRVWILNSYGEVKVHEVTSDGSLVPINTITAVCDFEEEKRRGERG